jgi:hypothetical protein
LADVGKTGFSVRMQEQESSKQVHDEELISYIAWEPSSGAYDGIAFEIGSTGDVVNDDFYSIYFQSAYQETPAFLAHMQSTDGGNTANVRWRNKDSYGVEVAVSEERSADEEAEHTKEDVGYAVFAATTR